MTGTHFKFNVLTFGLCLQHLANSEENWHLTRSLHSYLPPHLTKILLQPKNKENQSKWKHYKMIKKMLFKK
ncbi:hypothetical protein OIU77_011169 [Salix suchowensis]|uniref:Uncharacterized protein n=1 Tax=Salix suchowensis TaxID=1278906 RepID=A0ABQ9ACT0_9ROSI|nr:hypothetical protein OIU77_011169 [Salix suchowensis]